MDAPRTNHTHRDLEGHAVALTGHLRNTTRSFLIEQIQARGGVYAPRVNGHTTILVIGAGGLPLARNGRLRNALRQATRIQRRGQPLDILGEEPFLRRLGLLDPDRGTRDSHTLDELAALAGIGTAQLRAWLRAGLIQPIDPHAPRPLFDYPQVVTVKLLCELCAAGVSVSRLSRSLERLKRWLPNAQDALSRLKLISNRLVIRDHDGRLVDPNGQQVFDFDADDPLPSTPLALTHRASPVSDHQPNSDRPTDLLDQALKSEAEGRLELAVELYQRLLLTAGPTAVVCFNLGNALRQLCHDAAACERFRQAVELDPGLVPAWNNLGEALAETGANDEAQSAWRRALAADPQCAEALFNLADALHSSGRPAEARPYWRQYLLHDTQSQWADHARRCLG